MYTLINRDKTIVSGLFKNEQDAQAFADTHCPQLGLIPMELLLKKEHETVLLMNDLVTWCPEDETGPIQIGMPSNLIN